MRRIVLLAHEGFQALDLFGPAEVFSMASRFGGGDYKIEVVARTAGPISTSSGIEITPSSTFRSCRGPIDTLVVVGGEGVPAAEADPELVRWIGRAAERSRRVASVCNGAFLLAAAGLLDGRRATTHWAACHYLATRYPSITVEHDPIFVRDGNVVTSAGVTAGMDLALSLVDEDHGAESALRVARALVLFMRRPGGQAQFSAQIASQAAERRPLRELQAWIADNLDEDLSVPALADRAHMSPRNFARAFSREVGTTPAAYVEGVRVERARITLEDSRVPVEEVARRCGFGTVETMRRAFHRRLGVGPAAYRSRFRPLNAA